MNSIRIFHIWYLFIYVCIMKYSHVYTDMDKYIMYAWVEHLSYIIMHWQIESD